VAPELTLAAWALVELGVRVRERLQGRGGTARDRGTRVLIVVTLAAAIALAAVTASRATRIAVPYRIAGTIVMWVGLAIRVWAIATLGRAFRTTVEVAPGQTVVSTGPYRWVRHPSYGGLLLIVTGFGLAAGHWLVLIVCALLPLTALLRRVQIEEAELTAVLGDPYRAYQARTKRLIPGVW
jgi:protein-S-isoprenylcysteine O-methyltransferase Ste14